jgi:hypothetical protein
MFPEDKLNMLPARWRSPYLLEKVFIRLKAATPAAFFVTCKQLAA